MTDTTRLPPMPPPPTPSTLDTTTSIAAATPATSLFVATHSRALWRSRLGSALRTALACVIIGVMSVYTPDTFRRHATFPAFSYVTAVLIVGEATLGDVLHGAASALYGTVLGVLPATLAISLIRPTGFSVTATALMVALSSFVVALPESSGLVTKRVALGQIIIIYVAAFRQDGAEHAKAIMHPVHVAASTAVGVVASVLALVFPYPRLACNEVREKINLYMDMAGARLRILVNAFCADNVACTASSISQARCLASASTKVLQNIKLKQGCLEWERPPFRFSPPQFNVPSDRLQGIETALKGMEIALTSTTSVPSKFLDQKFKTELVDLGEQTSLRLKQDNFIANNVNIDKTFCTSSAIPQNPRDLPAFFFLFCMNLLCSGCQTTSSVEASQEKKVTPTSERTENSCKEGPNHKRIIKSPWSMNIRNERLVVTLKCSLSLGLATLLGLLLSKDNGYWAGLIVATTITPWREATFKLANARAQGTALGSAYGVIGSFISQNLMEIRFLELLPWIIFATFLRHSRMYGHAGGIAAIISGLIIMGRRHYGSPTIFTIVRLTETFIGLSCSVFVELLLQPRRASTLAREQLSRILRGLAECLESVVPSTSLTELKEKEKQLRQEVSALKKYIGEAEAEPNFWFLPFPEASFSKLHVSFSKMVELLLFLIKAMEVLTEDPHDNIRAAALDEIQQTTSRDLELFRKLVASSLKCLEEVIQAKSLARLEKELQGKPATSADIELGKFQGLHGYTEAWSADEEEECKKIVASLLQHGQEVLERFDVDLAGDSRSQVVLCLSTIGFCTGGLMKETKAIEKGILEVLQWENPSSHINVHEISCKIKELPT